MGKDHAGVEGNKAGRNPPSRPQSTAFVWLWLSVPLALLAFTGSVLGIVFEESVYGQETPNWAAQAVGQDVANLVAFPVLIVLALAVLRGSRRAYLAWAGCSPTASTPTRSTPSTSQFGPLFLLWVVVLGLSIYTLVGGLTNLDPDRVKATFRDRVPARSTAGLLLAIGAVFAVLWLSEAVPATLAGTTPPALVETGLATNPVHVLDLAVLLPAAVLAGVLVAKGRPLGYALAPVMLVATVFLAVGIVALMAVLAVRGLGTTVAVAVAIAVLAVAEVIVVVAHSGVRCRSVVV